MRLRLHTAGELCAGTVSFSWDQVEQVALAFGRFRLTAPDGPTLTPVFAPGPDGKLALTFVYAWCGSRSEESRDLKSVMNLGQPSAINLSRTSCVQMLKDTEAFVVPDTLAFYRTVTLPDLQQEAVRAITASMVDRSSFLSFIVLHPFHGVGENVSPSATAFELRRKHFAVGIYAFRQEGSDLPHRAWADAAEHALLPYALPGGYPNYLGPDCPLQAVHVYGKNAESILRVKAHYDPRDVFTATSLPYPRAGRLQ